MRSGLASAGSRVLTDRTRLASWILNEIPRLSGMGRINVAGSMGSAVQCSAGEGRGGPLRVCRASLIKE
jgi:hypothetical protein